MKDEQVKKVAWECGIGCCVFYNDGSGYGGTHTNLMPTQTSSGTACGDHPKWITFIGYRYCPVCGQKL
jgi:hypothetical protein